MQSSPTVRIVGRVRCVAVVAVMGVSPVVSAASFLPLGSPSGLSFSAAAVANGGTVVAGTSAASVPGSGKATVWSADSGFVILADLPGGATPSSVGDLTADGSSLAGTRRGAVADEAFRWTAGTGFETLPVPPIWSRTAANAMSDDGHVVVGRGISTQSPFRPEAIRWEGTSPAVGLGFLTGDATSSVASDVSSDGAVVVGNSVRPGQSRAFRWTAGEGMVDLGSLPAVGPTAEAYGVSGDGQVVVGLAFNLDPFSFVVTAAEAFRWTQGAGMTGLGYLPGDAQSRAAVASRDGSVIFGESATDLLRGSGRAAFRWTSADGMQPLLDWLVANGAGGLDGWTLDLVTAISADDQWIVGSGINPLGQRQAFLANITPVPLPAPLWLTLSGVAVLLGAVRRSGPAPPRGAMQARARG
jgi:probable HAF family extracellular repeat protein